MVGRATALLVALVITVACARVDQAAWLGAPKSIAPGVDLYQSTDATLLEPAAPIAVYLLKVDLDRVQVESRLSNERVMHAERVDAIARRHQAIAAVNGGFFNVSNGEPAGLLKVAGELVRDTALTRGVVAIHSRVGSRQRLYFDQVSARVDAQFTIDKEPVSVAVSGVNTTRGRGKLVLYTPAYNEDTDTAANGTEWILAGTPLRVVDIRRNLGKTPIPRDGAVLSFGGLEPPSPLEGLRPGTAVAFRTNWKILSGTPEARLEEARDIVNGAGLLVKDGAPLSGWQHSEKLAPGTFTDVRHPRTLIGVDRRGALWLIAVDGRQRDHSAGMTFAELLNLCRRLDLQDALNLDGGGTTTMVIGGQVVNRPSDASGPRAVSDAILITRR